MNVLKAIGNWLLDKWLAGFITASLYFFLKLYVELPDSDKENFFDFQWAVGILTIEIKLWKYILTSICFIGLYALLRRLRKSSYSYVSKKPKGLDRIMKEYRSDKFGVDNRKWVWGYEWNDFEERVDIINLVPACVQCDSPLQFAPYGDDSYAECPKCSLAKRPAIKIVNQSVRDVYVEILSRIDDKLAFLRS